MIGGWRKARNRSAALLMAPSPCGGLDAFLYTPCTCVIVEGRRDMPLDGCAPDHGRVASGLGGLLEK
jgi:hypothetical protein